MRSPRSRSGCSGDRSTHAIRGLSRVKRRSRSNAMHAVPLVVGSEPEALRGDVTYLLAFGLEVVRDGVDAIGPQVRRQPEVDETEARAQVREPRTVAQLGHWPLYTSPSPRDS